MEVKDHTSNINLTIMHLGCHDDVSSIFSWLRFRPGFISLTQHQCRVIPSSLPKHSLSQLIPFFDVCPAVRCLEDDNIKRYFRSPAVQKYYDYNGITVLKCQFTQITKMVWSHAVSSGLAMFRYFRRRCRENIFLLFSCLLQIPRHRLCPHVSLSDCFNLM